jgi:uncharacterized protein (TIGR02266 family)
VNENRKFNRTQSKLRCWCEGENVTVYARVGNMSEGGLFVRTSTPLARGSVARLRIGGEPSIEATARVVWSRVEGQGGQPGMGLAFERFEGDGLQAIRRIVMVESAGHLK